MRIRVRNRGPEAATLHVLPTLWFRNTWNWDPAGGKPALIASDGGRRIEARHADLGEYHLEVGESADGSRPTLLFCENETNLERIDGVPNTTPFPKDGINDHVVNGADTVNSAMTGTKAAAWYKVNVGPGDTAEIRLRLRHHGKSETAEDEAATDGKSDDPLGPSFEATMTRREKEADEFYAELR